MGRRETNVPPAGTVLRHTRIDDGQSVECIVTKHGFMFSGKVYPSLTGAARVAAKSIGLYPGVNGCLFWGLRSAPIQDRAVAPVPELAATTRPVRPPKPATAAEVARLTGRSRQAVSQLLAKGYSVERIKNTPKGGFPSGGGRKQKFAAEGNIHTWASILNLRYDTIYNRAMKIGSLAGAVEYYWPGAYMLGSADEISSHVAGLPPRPKLRAPGCAANRKNISDAAYIATIVDMCNMTYAEAKNSFSRAYVVSILRACNGNVTAAAAKAGMDRSNFRRLLAMVRKIPRRRS